MRPVASRHVVEKVVLPAGYCLYYARGRGTPLLQADPQQGRPVRSSSKGLGVINPDSHNVVEEEYAIIREVVEIYLEEQVAEEEEQEEGGSSHVTDPRLEQQRALLDDLRVTLPEDHGTVQLRSEASPLQDDDPGSQPDAVIRSLDTSRSFPATARANGRCLLPISKALRANISPRGPFLMEGQSVLDTGREGFPRQRPQDQQPEAFSRQASDDSAELPEDHVDRSEGPSHDDHRGDRAADNPLVSHFRSVTSPLPPMVAVKQKTQQLEVKYGLIRSVSYRDQRNTRYDRFRRKRFSAADPCVTSFPTDRKRHCWSCPRGLLS
ncbi:uncharacterized protein LOC143298089 [Babylonia areolata]|uniref:uncharacterized protein LOC143298089 n=1 Tax=Babylonia areolata TaxID=304850 RepID=UPI003FD217E5